MPKFTWSVKKYLTPRLPQNFVHTLLVRRTERHNNLWKKDHERFFFLHLPDHTHTQNWEKNLWITRLKRSRERKKKVLQNRTIFCKNRIWFTEVHLSVYLIICRLQIFFKCWQLDWTVKKNSTKKKHTKKVLSKFTWSHYKKKLPRLPYKTWDCLIEFTWSLNRIV